MEERTSAAGLYSTGQNLLDRLHTAAVRPTFHSFGRSARLCRPFRVRGAHGISLGERVYVGPGSWLVTGSTASTGECGPVLRLDDEVEIAGQVVLSAVKDVRVEEGVLMARGVYVADHSHAFADPEVPIKDQGITVVEAVRIGAGAWLGQNVVVLPGVEIGRGSVVAANSVVRGSVPARTLVAGTPARVIRHLDG